MRSPILELQKGMVMTETPEDFVDRTMRRRGNVSDVKTISKKRNDIIVEGTPQERELIEAVITSSFTREEKEAMVKKGSLVISVKNLPLGIAGIYEADHSHA